MCSHLLDEPALALRFIEVYFSLVILQVLEAEFYIPHVPRPTLQAEICTGLQVHDLLNAPLQMKLSAAITLRFLKRLTVFTHISTYLHTDLSGPLWASLALSVPL